MNIKMSTYEFEEVYNKSIIKYFTRKVKAVGSIRKLSDISGLDIGVISRAINGKSYPKISTMQKHFPDFEIDFDIIVF